MASRVLLADDSITIQKVVNLTFADEGIDVVSVSNGEMAQRRLAEINPDLVLADIFMPGKNGYELCQYIKESPQFRTVPVVLLVGASEPFDQAEARRVNADGHLTKPFESRTLVETVRKLIQERKTASGQVRYIRRAAQTLDDDLLEVIEELVQLPLVAPPAVTTETRSALEPVLEPTPIRILHLSDLHLGKDADPGVFLHSLVRDTKDAEDGLGFEALDYLVVSGDLTNHGSAEEFGRVHGFLSALMSRFELSASRCIIVPGNHDLSWDTEGVYDWRPERKVPSNELKEGRYVRQGKLCGIRDDAVYPKRFENFARFYHQLTQQPYPLNPALQCVPFLFEEPGIQFLAANSAWEIDEYFPDRSGINQSALAAGLSHASEQIQIARKEGRIGKDDSVLRIAVWHHPVTGNERILQDAFLGQLRQEDFNLCLHGHVHEDRADLVGYLHPRRKVHVAGAGSFGAPVRERPEATPRLYNLIEVARDHSRIRIHTRCLRKDGGAWEGWAVWPGDKSTERKTYYEIGLTQRR